MAHTFQAVLAEGLFFDSPDPYPDANGSVDPTFRDLRVTGHRGEFSVYSSLRPLVGQQVYLTAHHVPVKPEDTTLWAGGACLWQGGRVCPFGHHEHPHRLFNLIEQGILVYDRNNQDGTGGWGVLGRDGVHCPVPFSAMLGHLGRVACATMLSAELIRGEVLKAGLDVEALGQRINDLRGLVSDLARLTEEG